MTEHQTCISYQKFDVRRKKIRYGVYKQSILMCGHRLIHSYRWEKEITIELSNVPINGSCVFVGEKAYMVSSFSGGRETTDNGKTWSNVKLSLVEIDDLSRQKFRGHGIVYACDVQQLSDDHDCPCNLGRAIL